MARVCYSNDDHTCKDKHDENHDCLFNAPGLSMHLLPEVAYEQIL